MPHEMNIKLLNVGNILYLSDISAFYRILIASVLTKLWAIEVHTFREILGRINHERKACVMSSGTFYRPPNIYW